ncbi:MAG: hypothetical protein QOK11_2749 [Pseudonocardiales bacterium]|nr:hypothetical protein [Pseudonocardiales bacterium]
MQDLPSEARDAIAATIPMRRLAASEEIANLVAFLLSDEATFMSGEVVAIDGAYMQI